MKPHEFYEILPDGRWKFRIDNSKLKDANLCDRYFKYRHIPDANGKVWGSKDVHGNIKMEIGSWWSTTMELFYREMGMTKQLPTSHHMLKFARDAWEEHKMEDFSKADPKSKTYENFVKFGGVEGALTMSLEYYNAFAHRHFVDWAIVGAELGFGWKDEVLVGSDDKVVVYWGGKPDLVVVDKAQNMVLPLDFKSKDSVPGNAVVTFKPHTQTAMYIFAIREILRKLREENPQALDAVREPTKCIVMICARIRPTDKPRDGVRKPRFCPVYPQYNSEELEEQRVEVIEKCRRIRDAIERNAFPSRDSACHLYYHGCQFRSVCSMPPSIRDIGLKSDFAKIDPWIPYEVDED